MGDFMTAVLSFPALVFTFALVVVVMFWLCVLAGAVEHDAFEGDAGGDALGLGGVPVTVTVSLLVAFAWALSLAGGVVLDDAGLPDPAAAAAGTGVLLAAVAAAWTATRILVRPLGHLFPDEPGPSRRDFVGTTCIIRTGRVDAHFGQAEVTARDGATAIVQVRQDGTDVFEAGGTGLLYAYDEDGEFFWVAPFDAALDPGHPSA
ncbi:hypothetical protein [Yinghuangia soli]|uniref:DUF1449 family protein n=1 Tax=Yinghuangia soli TaxID=2908204 RepID=A0AA41Q5C7_9ACTN|nr:hypothetical protein [Yinghuangia soli]MCF2531596.1 hypothetical protein [Yinghuangia soli]